MDHSDPEGIGFFEFGARIFSGNDYARFFRYRTRDFSAEPAMTLKPHSYKAFSYR